MSFSPFRYFSTTAFWNQGQLQVSMISNDELHFRGKFLDDPKDQFEHSLNTVSIVVTQIFDFGIILIDIFIVCKINRSWLVEYKNPGHRKVVFNEPLV